MLQGPLTSDSTKAQRHARLCKRSNPSTWPSTHSSTRMRMCSTRLVPSSASTVHPQPKATLAVGLCGHVT